MESSSDVELDNLEPNRVPEDFDLNDLNEISNPNPHTIISSASCFQLPENPQLIIQNKDEEGKLKKAQTYIDISSGSEMEISLFQKINMYNKAEQLIQEKKVPNPLLVQKGHAFQSQMIKNTSESISLIIEKVKQDSIKFRERFNQQQNNQQVEQKQPYFKTNQSTNQLEEVKVQIQPATTPPPIQQSIQPGPQNINLSALCSDSRSASSFNSKNSNNQEAQQNQGQQIQKLSSGQESPIHKMQRALLNQDCIFRTKKSYIIQFKKWQQQYQKAPSGHSKSFKNKKSSDHLQKIVFETIDHSVWNSDEEFCKQSNQLIQNDFNESPRFIGNSVASFDQFCKGQIGQIERVTRHMNFGEFTNFKQPVFSCLDFYDQEQSSELIAQKEKYKKKTNRKQTLIFEMVGTMIKILDPAKDTFSMQDQQIKQLTCLHEGAVEILFVKFFPKVLLKTLKSLQAYYEVIVFTIIPRRFLDLIIKEMPQFTQVTNFILSLEDTNKNNPEFVVRDVSIFLQNRTREDIQVIDVDQEAVDTDCLTSVHPEPYDGSILYKQLNMLIDSLKQYRKVMQEQQNNSSAANAH